jgi:DNA primase
MSSSPIEEIKNRLDIVEVISSYIKIEKAGANYRGPCPFHSEKTPSFFVSPVRQIWHCFGSCSEGGDIFKFVMKIEGVEFGDALRILAKKAGVELKKESPKLKTERLRLYDISELACRFFEAQLKESPGGKEAKKYLLGRGVSEESIKKWRLGYAPDVWQGLSDFLVGRGYKREEAEKAGLSLRSPKSGNYYDRFRGRIIFPVFNLSSQVVGFGGRILLKAGENKKEEVAKYINSPATMLYDKSRILYGLNKAGMEIRKEDACILVEGYMDAIMASQSGLENVVATSGTALTPYHLKILKRYSNNLLTAFDMDIAGNSATKRGIDMAQDFGFDIKIVEMPQGADPADVAFKNPGKLKNLVKEAKSIHDFYFENTLSKFDKNSLEGKKKISEVLLPVIKRIPNKIEQEVWIKDLADVLGVKEESVSEELQKISLRRSGELNREEKIGKEAEKGSRRKTRKELLEEYLVVLAIKSPENISLLGEEDFKLFSLQISQLINYIKKKGAGLAGVSAEMGDALNYFSLKSEIEEIEDDKIKEEFKNCLREIRKLAVREELNMISQKIKKAEQEKDFEKVNKLVQKFNQSSKSRSEAEAD